MAICSSTIAIAKNIFYKDGLEMCGVLMCGDFFIRRFVFSLILGRFMLYAKNFDRK